MRKGRMTVAAKEMAAAYPELPAFLLECSQHNRWYSVFDRFFPYHQERCFCRECLKEMREKEKQDSQGVGV